jgi:hypothetical protein
MAINPTTRVTYSTLEKLHLKTSKARAILAVMAMCEEVMGARPSLPTVKVMVDSVKDNLNAIETDRVCREFLEYFQDINGGVDLCRMVRALRVRGMKVTTTSE